MKKKYTFGFAIMAVLLMAAFGLYAFKKGHPTSLGFLQAQIDDRGLLELAVDELRSDLKTVEPALLRSISPLITAELNRSSDWENSSLSYLANFQENSGKKITAFHFEVDFIEMDNLHTVVHGTVRTEQQRKQRFKLIFNKEDSRWKLIDSRNFFSLWMEMLQKDAFENLASHPTREFVIYDEPSASDENTLTRIPISEEHDIDRLTQSTTLHKLNRQLFQKPYSGVLYSTITQFNEAPFISARYVQLVTDPAWNRVVYGDYDGWLKAYGNTGAGSEDLNRPHGLDRDIEGNIYVADTGNHRIVVLRLVGNGKDTELKFQFAFGSGQLLRPYDVAWDDAGTPFDRADDIVWVADTGQDRIVGYAVNDRQASVAYLYGQPGKAAGNFFEPQALAVGKFDGRSNGKLYVADTGNRRLVQLAVFDDRLEWVAEFAGKPESQFTSIDVDHWGNLYVADRSYGELWKLTADFEPLAAIHSDNEAHMQPVNLHVTFGQFISQSEGTRYWAGFDQAFVLGDWSHDSGAERYKLGLDLNHFYVVLASELDKVCVRARLTDHARVALNVIDTRTGLTLRHLPARWMVPGDKEFFWDRSDDIGWQVEAGYYRLQLVAESSYGNFIAIKETPEFYLPLYYWEDCGGVVQGDAHLVQGTRDADWGTLPHQTIVKHPSEVVYRFTDLNPTVDYELKAQFFNKVGAYLKQKIIVNDLIIFDEFEVVSGLSDVNWLQLPKHLYADGKIEIRIVKTAGDEDALISQLWLREAAFDPARPPVLHESGEQKPDAFSLSQNYPNPFNPSTTIEFGVPSGNTGRVSLKILNILGQTVKTLVDEYLPGGRHLVIWNGRNQSNRPVASGVYFYQLSTIDPVKLSRQEILAVKKLLLIK